MEVFEFDKNASIALYTKWLTEKENQTNSQYSKQQVDDLFTSIKLQISPILEYYTNHDSDAYKASIPVFYVDIRRGLVREFEVDICVVGNLIECINIPGCIVDGKSINDAFDNLIRAIIQCSDARALRGLYFLNRVFPIRIWVNGEESSRSEFLSELSTDGWNQEYIGPYHTVLFRTNSKVTYTIANTPTISSIMIFAYNRLRFLTSSKISREMHRNTNDYDY